MIEKKHVDISTFLQKDTISLNFAVNEYAALHFGKEVDGKVIKYVFCSFFLSFILFKSELNKLHRQGDKREKHAENNFLALEKLTGTYLKLGFINTYQSEKNKVLISTEDVRNVSLLEKHVLANLQDSTISISDIYMIWKIKDKIEDVSLFLPEDGFFAFNIEADGEDGFFINLHYNTTTLDKININEGKEVRKTTLITSSYKYFLSKKNMLDSSDGLYNKLNTLSDDIKQKYKFYI